MDKTLDRATKTRIWWVEIRPILLTLVPIAGWGYGFVYSVSHHNPVLTVSTVAVGACSGAGCWWPIVAVRASPLRGLLRTYPGHRNQLRSSHARHKELARIIWWGVRQDTRMRSGLATMMAITLAREVATVTRYRS